MSTIPKRLGKYELQQQLGRGSVGEVWKGQDVTLNRDVAVKIIHTDLQSDPHFLTRFTTEGQSITSLHHSNIVTVRDVGVDRSEQGNETTAYLVMDYIEGQTLADYLSATSHRGLFPSIAQIVYLFTSLGVAIDYAHQKGIVHGNIRPSNILLNKRDTVHFEAGEPMLTDFGLPRLLGNSASVGSPVYMSPEQAKAEAPNNRSDIYSLGVILYEICTGVQPFRDESSVAVMMQHINALPTPPSLINPNIPPALSEVILRAMAKDTATRFSMASLLATAIADACSIEPSLPVSLNKYITLDDSYALSNPRMAILGVPQPISDTNRSSVSQPLPKVSQPLPKVSQPLPKVSQPLPGISQPIPKVSQPLSPPAGMPAMQQQAQLSRQTGQMAALTRTDHLAAQPTAPYISSVTPTPPLSAPPPTTAAIPALPPGPPLKKRDRMSFADTPVYVVTAALILLLLVIGSAIGMNLLIKAQSNGKSAANATTTGDSVGQVYFQDDALGHDDMLRILIQNTPAPAQGKSYVAWLQKSDQQVIQLGTLTAQGNTASLTYAGDGRHTDLLSIMQGIFITQENSNALPMTPSGSKLYQATLDKASFPYIRNILIATPGLPGKQSAIDALLDNIKSINDKAGSIVDSLQGTHDYGLVHRQAIRIVELIDSTAYARSSGDLPAQEPSLAFTRVGLLSSPSQKGYLDLIADQLAHIKQTAGSDKSLLTHEQNAQYAITDLQNWVQKMRAYDVQILKAADVTNPAIIGVALQLKQSAADSYTGRTIPPNDGPQPIPGSAGAYQGYIECQYMATLDLHKA